MNRAAIEAGVALSAKLRNELIPECATTIAWKPLETLLSAIEAAQALLAEREWKDIESAPKDGTQVDLWAAERDRYENSRIADCMFFEGRCVHIRTIYDEETIDELAELCHPTHWRPRPKPPALSPKEPDNE